MLEDIVDFLPRRVGISQVESIPMLHNGIADHDDIGEMLLPFVHRVEVELKDFVPLGFVNCWFYGIKGVLAVALCGLITTRVYNVSEFRF